MKAKLVLSVEIEEEEEAIFAPDGWLNLYLVTDTKSFLIIGNVEVYNDIENIDRYISELEDVVNEAEIIINSIPGLKLIIDQSVCEFIEGKEEEIKKSIQMLITVI